MRTLFIISILFGLTSCVQKQHIKEVTIKVDTKGIQDVKTIGVKGNFTSPRWKVEIPLTDDDNDGVFEAKLTQETAVSSIEFKLVKNNSIYELKGKPNRVLKFEYKPETIVYKVKYNDPEFTIKRN
ncbi:hypothetical protein [Tenacibaculum jejuense]|uniref:Probable lipoprotein n=1 Tax=Tenacibaculum jejuense TaxID=584609 RepID=A0A238UDY3_9FLAO|nr:hypothetical protein [Tenacibaculum jejuense]SNR17413.1 Probable lipoprotein precursor [Tenacibaculum jejuense]